MVYPKKRLGQHFLTDQSIAGRIVDALDPPEGDTVIEVGPGKGILTSFLMERKINLLPVEIDPESVQHLLKEWPVLTDSIIQGDILKLDLFSKKNWSRQRIEANIFFQKLNMVE